MALASKYSTLPPVASISLGFITDNRFRYLSQYYNTFQTITRKMSTNYAVCRNCGSVYIKNNRRHEFCSYKCRGEFFSKTDFEIKYKLAIKNVTEKDIKDFRRKYEDFIYSLIYEGNSENREDLLDYYSEYLLLFVYRLKNSCKSAVFKYLRKCFYGQNLTLLNKKQNEIFYDELSYKNKMAILGEADYEQ